MVDPVFHPTFFGMAKSLENLHFNFFVGFQAAQR